MERSALIPAKLDKATTQSMMLNQPGFRSWCLAAVGLETRYRGVRVRLMAELDTFNRQDGSGMCTRLLSGNQTHERDSMNPFMVLCSRT